MTINSAVTVVFNSEAEAISLAAAVGQWQCNSNGMSNSAAVVIHAAVTMIAAATGEMGMD